MTDNQRGSLFMTLSMAGFAVEDMFIKSTAQSLPVGQVLLVMGLCGALWFALLSHRASEPALPPALWSRTMALRSCFEVTGRLFYALAIALTPLSVASSILQATPLVVVLGAALIFDEKVGARRWMLTTLGFIGVLVILRPGLDGFDAQSLLAVIGLIGFAGRDLATRAAPPVLSNAQLGTAGFLVLAASGAVILAVTHRPELPDPVEAAQILGATVFGVLGYSFLTRAMRTGAVSAVTPFRYTRLLFAMALGMAVFGERPDAATLIGAAIIILCGVLILTRR
ncbi:DMT family transporter [Tabrizicola oligotrophica]|uniref:DMT family transporter n=1 Tax=Tabrizicola oligotrophica TaxID=2710650 RepID=A0A6M0QS64_9RHOB|nr:DMT family transporter [Tabrizicola oligotrophica]NEY90268.1 DMT family transporter [Tabrizicola oligotrophica]